MVRLQLILAVVTVLCALSVVNANHQARKLFVALGAEQKHARELETEWGQLQLEQSTWAAHIRVENLARGKLGMRRPAPGEIMTAELAIPAAPPVARTPAH
jgi:cell division protein FtsL